MYALEKIKYNTNDHILNFALCEDDPIDIEHCTSFLDTCAKKLNLRMTLKVFQTAEELLFDLEENPSKYDLIFMDIMIHQKNGIDVVRTLRGKGSFSKIIFLTSTEDYVYDAFEVQADYYLVKEKCDVNKFQEVLSNVLGRIQNVHNDLFYFEFGGIKYLVHMKDIYYFEVWNKVVTINYNKKTQKFYANLNDVMHNLNNHFFQVHRSYVVNLHKVSEVYKNEIVLSNGNKIPLGRTYAGAFEKALLKFVENSIAPNLKVDF